MEEVVLVNSKNRRVGLAEKIEAHRLGLRHRAFSIFVFDQDGNLLIQKRALTKYHSGGLWSNTCCGHPRPNERLLDASQRRLFEEMGISCDLKIVGRIAYQAELGELIENEIDFIIVGTIGKTVINPNDQEISEYRWINLNQLKKDIGKWPEKYTEWFRLILDEKLAKLILENL